MQSIKVETTVQAPFHLVVNNFNEDLFTALAPAFPPSKLISFDGDKVGGLVKIQLGIPPASQTWISEIISRSESDKKLEFVDKGIQLPFPLRQWEHRHVVEKLNDCETLVIDDIKYHCGSRILNKAMYPIMSAMFRKRSPAYKTYFLKLVKKGAQ